MSKIVKLDAQNVLGREFSIMDTYNNGKIVGKGLRKVYQDLSALDDKSKKDPNSVNLVDYSTTIHADVMEEVPKLLHLSATETKKLQDSMSYSDMEKFYGDCCREFTGINLPTMTLVSNASQRLLANDQNGNSSSPAQLHPVKDPKDTSEQ